MTDQLAALFKERLTNPPGGVYVLPFLDRVAGLTREYVRSVPNGEEMRRVTLPVPVTFTEADCERDPRFLVPDNSTGSILYFEDGGTVPETIATNVTGWQSSLRLILWLNPTRLGGELNEAAIINALHRALGLTQRRTMGPFQNLLSTYSVLPGAASLLSRYTYTDSPMLYPPYRVLALDIKCSYTLSAECYNAALPTLQPAAQC